MKKLITGVLIDPKERTVTQVTLEKKDYKQITKLIGCRIFSSFEWVNGDTAYLDDEGLIQGDEHLKEVGCYRLKCAEQSHLAGRTLILNFDEEGEAESSKSSVEEVKNQIEWVDTPTTEELDNLLDIKVMAWDDFTFLSRGLRKETK